MFARKLLHTYLAAAICLALGIALCGPAAAQVGPAPKPKEKSAPPKASLVNADDEYADELAEVLKMIMENEDIGLAIQILQAMILRNDSCFLATDSPSIFVGLRVKANEVLGTLPPAGLKMYREMYDAQAQVFYNEALAGDRTKLRLLVDRYPHTSFGPAATDLMAAVYFDHGRFTQAALCWQQLLNTHPPEDSIPLIVAKIAVAHHLACDTVAADNDLKTLKDRYPRTSGMLGGENRNLVELVLAANQITPDSQGAPQDFIPSKRVWPGLAGIPNGNAVMSDCDTLLVSRWLMTANEWTGIKDPNELKITSDLMALQEQFNNPQALQQQQLTVRINAGQVQLRNKAAGGRSVNLAPTIQPVIVDDQVIYRTSQSVIACNIVTGEVIWKMGNFPI